LAAVPVRSCAQFFSIMHLFEYRKGRLFCEDVGIEHIADGAGTPVYVYSAGTIRDHFTRLDDALGGLDHLVCYAVKASSNIALLSLLARLGAGFDIVSGGELFRVLKAGGDPAKCTFAGVGKSEEEIRFALEQGVYCLNAESEAELECIDKIARRMKKVAPVAVRVNPDVEADTHKYISTGRHENKFGIGMERVGAVYAAVARMKNVRIRGVQMHIGSQITKPGPFRAAVEKMQPLVTELKRAHGIEFFSIGGGIGIVYQHSLESGRADWWNDAPENTLTIEEYARAVVPSLKALDLRVLFEPGRFIVGNAGVLVTRVRFVKQALAKKFVVVDAGMNDLIRPALYESYHEIVHVNEPDDPRTEPVDVVGPICESGDFFAQDRELGPLESGDLVALMSAGAYGFSMASNYNSRPLVAEVLVDGKQWNIIRERQTHADLVRGERIPAVKQAAKSAAAGPKQRK
jgi:diaminopimelate decarboxylase